VNGLAWPNMNVDKGQYALKILDGSDARWYDLSMSNGMQFTVIAADGNYLRSPVTTTSLTVAPGERFDVVVDFSDFVAGAEITLINKASAHI
jgi:spore coat protein A